jgi:hypothetical protein
LAPAGQAIKRAAGGAEGRSRQASRCKRGRKRAKARPVAVKAQPEEVRRRSRCERGQPPSVSRGGRFACAGKCRWLMASAGLTPAGQATKRAADVRVDADSGCSGSAGRATKRARAGSVGAGSTHPIPSRPGQAEPVRAESSDQPNRPSPSRVKDSPPSRHRRSRLDRSNIERIQ